MITKIYEDFQEFNLLMVNIQKSIVFLNINNEQLENKNLKTISFIIA